MSNEAKSNPKILEDMIVNIDKKLNNELKTLQNEFNKQRDKFETLQVQVDKTDVKQFTDILSLKDKCDKLSAEMNKKADASSIASLNGEYTRLNKAINEKAKKSDIEEIRKSHGFNTCISRCFILLFNILAIWLIIYRPALEVSIETSELSWLYILPLIAIMFVNLVNTVIWIHSLKFWPTVIEIILLIFNMVSIWLFAFYPLNTVAGAVIALAVFMMLSNIAMIIERILYFVWDNTNANFDILNNVSSILLVIKIVLCIVVCIIFIGWIRV